MAYFKFTEAIYADQPIHICNHGHMSRDFTFIDEVVEATRRLVVKPPAHCVNPGQGQGQPDARVPHRIFNVGNHTPVELGYFADALEALIGRKAQRRYLPMQPGDVEHTYADVELLRREVGFTPRTSIENGLAHFVRWYHDVYRAASRQTLLHGSNKCTLMS